MCLTVEVGICLTREVVGCIGFVVSISTAHNSATAFKVLPFSCRLFSKVIGLSCAFTKASPHTPQALSSLLTIRPLTARNRVGKSRFVCFCYFTTPISL